MQGFISAMLRCYLGMMELTDNAWPAGKEAWHPEGCLAGTRTSGKHIWTGHSRSQLVGRSCWRGRREKLSRTLWGHTLAGQRSVVKGRLRLASQLDLEVTMHAVTWR